jgi:hypothetical protein
MNNFIISFSIFFFLSLLLKKIWVSALSEKSYMVIAFFGIIVHELSHLIFCLIFRAKVEKAKLFSAKGGYVTCGKPKIPLGRFFIGFAPILGGIAVLFFLFNIFNLEFNLGQIADWKFWVFLILSSSILSYIAPSKADLKASFLGLIFVILIFFILNYFKISLPDSLYQKSYQLFLMMIKIEILSIILGLFFLFVKFLKRLSHI